MHPNKQKRGDVPSAAADGFLRDCIILGCGIFLGAAFLPALLGKSALFDQSYILAKLNVSIFFSFFSLFSIGWLNAFEMLSFVLLPLMSMPRDLVHLHIIFYLRKAPIFT